MKLTTEELAQLRLNVYGYLYIGSAITIDIIDKPTIMTRIKAKVVKLLTLGTIYFKWIK